MALSLNIIANTVDELKGQLLDLLAGMKGVTFKGNEPPDKLPEPKEIKPVLTQAQMEENIKNAPEHRDPPQPSLEEVRAALKQLRDRKGSAAVKELLKAYGADSLPNLKPEDYLGARDRALMEV